MSRQDLLRLLVAAEIALFHSSLAACDSGERIEPDVVVDEEELVESPGETLATEDVGPDTAAVGTYVYTCGGGYQFTVRIRQDTAWLLLPDETVALPHVAAASGARYSDGEVTYWSSGAEARLETGSTVYQGCRSEAADSPWEAARLRGADFRAIGQEPGWHLEIVEGERVTLVTDYGESRVVTTAPEPEVDPEVGRTTYRMQTEVHDVVIVLEERACQDVMSGEEFPTTVTVTLDSREYHGCGRGLQ